MLLSIDRVLQLLAEGKDADKIAQLADSDRGQVIDLIEEARAIVNRKDSSKARKKVKIRKKFQQKQESESFSTTDDLFRGADLKVMPLEETLQFYIAVQPILHAVSVGVIICDSEDRQVGSIQLNESGEKSEQVLTEVMKRCEKIAAYFNSKRVRIKIDNERVYNMYKGKLIQKVPACEKNLEYLRKSAEKYDEFLIELIDSFNNQKAAFLLNREK